MRALGVLAMLAAACTAPPKPTEPLPASGPSAVPPARTAAPAVTAAPDASSTSKAIAFVEDDVPRAMAEARARQKALFVDAWAAWCHTCLSMKSYVFTDPSLEPLGERVIFAAIDTDRETNATFLERYEVDVWPTFFMIDPTSGRVVGHWTGAASARELRGFVEDSLDAFDALRRGTLASASPEARLLDAKAAQAAGRYPEAAEHFRDALARAPADWPRRSEALLGRLQSLYYAGRHAECVRLGLEHVKDVQGAARPADFADYMLSCAGHVRDQALTRAARDAAIERLRAVTAQPSPEMSVDDQADALAKLADALRARGEGEPARAADEARLELMERAAKAAPSPQVAATYDYGRANAYVALGRAEDAVQLLTQRQRELPDAYDPPARLAALLTSLGRHREALVAIDRALTLSYGRPKLRYLARKAQILGALGDRAAQVAALEQEVSGWKALPSAQARPRDVRDAERRLADARRATSQR